MNEREHLGCTLELSLCIHSTVHLHSISSPFILLCNHPVYLVLGVLGTNLGKDVLSSRAPSARLPWCDVFGPRHTLHYEPEGVGRLGVKGG